MHIGCQVEAPNGFGELIAGERYYYALSSAVKGRVLLVHFIEGKNSPDVALLWIPRARFEKAIADNVLSVCQLQRRYPYWLPEVSRNHYDEVDGRRHFQHPSNRQYVEDRFRHIEYLVSIFQDILSTDDPVSVINSHANQCNPKQNTTRLRLWFFTYICHGFNIWALMRCNHKIGLWDRGSAMHKNTRFGATGLKGRYAGYSAVPIKNEIVASYLRYCGLGRSMRSIYRISMTKIFGCKVVTVNRRKVLTHPSGKPFPTEGQYRYWVVREFGLSKVQTTLYGHARMRTKVLPSQGRFTEELANLLERIEVDAFHVKERPVSVLDGSPMPPLVVARAICCTSGAVVGIGFSFGSETSVAYRMMLFSMAISKSKFCELFGIFGITDEEWCAIGLPGAYVSDRGPGRLEKLASDLQRQFPIRQLAQSWEGQSKALVESSHPRSVKSGGAPSYVLSGLDAIEMVRKEIMRAISDNHTSFTGDRLLGIKGGEDVLPTPHETWRFLDRLGRTDACPMALDDAVRSFLDPIEFTLGQDELRLYERVYDSDALRQSGIYERLAGTQSISLKGYCVPFSLRQCWVDIDGRLLELTMRTPLRTGSKVSFVSLADLEQEAEKEKKLRSEHREHAHAASIHFTEKLREVISSDHSFGRRVSGTPPSSAAQRANIEVQLIKGIAQPSKGKKHG